MATRFASLGLSASRGCDLSLISITNPEHAGPAKQRCTEMLDGMLAAEPNLEFLCLGLVDGRVWAFSGNRSDIDAARVSALTTSTLALNEAYAKEVLLGRCKYSVMSLDRGTIIAVRVPCRSQLFALSSGFGSGENVAMSLRTTLDAADKLGRLLDELEASRNTALA
jgi:predicted regulator of Ras-like GTPase activity (Roadblock/LC7/MglB family)